MPDTNIQSAPNPPAIEAAEWQMRCDMAAVFRVAARLGWNEQIGNHNSLMLPTAPGEAPQFLINPRGLLFQELTASNLIVCDLEGRVLRGTGELRQVAFHIHARIHLRHPAAACVMHVHPQYLTALSLLAEPELALAHHNNLLLNDRIRIDQGGDAPAASHEEGDRLAEAIDGASILVMGGHGVTVAGPTVAVGDRFAYLRLGMDELRLIGLGILFLIAAFVAELVAILGVALIGGLIGVVAGKTTAIVIVAVLAIALFCGAIYARSGFRSPVR